MLAHNPF